MKFELIHPCDQIEQTMARIYSRDMTTTSGGNVSTLDEAGDVWITPARLDKGELKAADMVKLNLAGDKLKGVNAASSEYPFHLGIYQERPDIRAVIHAHPSALVSFSICGQVPDTRVFPEAWNVCGKVAFAPYALPGSERLAEHIAAEFAKSSEVFCVVLQNHGVVVGGTDLEDAFKRFETLEFTARTLIRAKSLSLLRALSDAELSLASPSLPVVDLEAKHAPSSRELELRKDICKFMQRAYAHRLVTSTWGSLSARVDARSFVITPYGVDRHRLAVEDLVLIRDGQCVSGKHPSRAVRLHQSIYENHPEIESVINALPIHATAFSISETTLDTRTIPESYLFLKDVPSIPFADVLLNPEKVSLRVGLDNPVALLEHNGVLVAGRTVLDAFDRLEVLEATAEAIINSRPLGPIAPMADSVIEELIAKFGRV